MWVGGIRSAEDYARVIGYLGESNLVRGVQPTQARGDGVLVRLSLRGSLSASAAMLWSHAPAHVRNASPPVDGVDALLDCDAGHACDAAWLPADAPLRMPTRRGGICRT